MSNVKIGAEAWDERFSGDGWAYGREPNVWLAERISMLSPGKALFRSGLQQKVGNHMYLISQV